MSSNSLEQVSLVDGLLTPHTMASFGDFATAALLFYDIILTFDREVACIWKRKFSTVSVIFICMRYASLLSQVGNIAIDMLPRDTLSCRVIVYLAFSSNVLSRIASSAFGCLRVWAIWGRHYLLLLVILALTLLAAVVSMYQMITSQSSLSELSILLNSCYWTTTTPFPPGAIPHIGVATRSCAIIADAIIAAATCVKTWSIRRELQGMNLIHSYHSKISLSGLLLRDGTVYFIVLFTINVICLIFDLLPRFGYFNPVPVYIDVATAVLLCRLVLSLRSYNSIGDSIYTGNDRLVSMHFAPAARGNGGASLSWDEYGSIADTENPGCELIGPMVDETVHSPLAVGLKADIRRLRSAGLTYMENDITPTE